MFSIFVIRWNTVSDNYLLLESFSHQPYLIVFHQNLSDSKTPQINRTLLSILADFNNVVVWMVSTHPIISKSTSSSTNLLVTVPRAPVTIGLTITFIFHSFFNSQAKSRYLSFFLLSFNFTLQSARTAKSTIWQVLFFLLIIIRSGCLVEIRWSICVSKSQRSLCVSFFRTDSGVVSIPFVRIVKSKFLAQFPVHNLAHPIASSFILFLCKFAALTYYVINHFVSITTWPISATLLQLIYSYFDMISSYGIVLCCY